MRDGLRDFGAVRRHDRCGWACGRREVILEYTVLVGASLEVLVVG